ncbi:hypothetical protein [Symbioplanes lichenis]|uniref:hypothetical protein n=1 Tax=Symbioplanes lichenis TaxID=1629072 RepID=UPI0027386A96|nr:hypothetical protein [Actinoplanes lichenis]
MTAGPVGSPEFAVVPVVVDTYAHHPALHEAWDVARLVSGLLTEHLEGATVEWPAAEERTETSIRQQLGAWAQRRDGRSALVFWLGHGTSDGLDAWLAAYETPPIIAGSGLNPQSVADLLTVQWRHRFTTDGAWTLLVVEACGAATFVRRASAALLAAPNGPKRLAVVGVGGDDSAGNLGQFGEILRATLDSYTDNDGPEIRVDEFVSNMRARLDPGEVIDLGLQRATPLRRRRLLSTTVTAPLDIYADLQKFLVGLPADERRHFVPKAQGAEEGELAWYFVGRHAERHQTSSWLHERTTGMLVVTGPAGSGKSALLGNVLVYTNKTLRDLLIAAGQLESVPDWELPPEDPFDLVVHLTGMTAATLAVRIAEAAGLTPSPGTDSASASAWLVSALRERDRSFTILADALDEAQEPYEIARRLLSPIAALPACRVVIGTRRSLRDDPDRPGGEAELLEMIGRDLAPDVIVVDRDAAALGTYVHRRLRAARKAALIDVDDHAVAEIARLVRDQGRQFLFARLAVHELLARPELADRERRPELAGLLRLDHRRLFAAAVERLTLAQPSAAPLLAALALTRGRGLPRADRVWAALARALAPPGVAVGETDIDSLVTRAAPYIMLDAEGGQSVYRLAHRTFRDHFLASTDLTAAHRALASALIAPAGPVDRAVPNPYVVRYLAAHVAAGEMWPALAAAVSLLDHLDPDSVAAEVLRAADPAALPPAVLATSRSRHVLAAATPGDRRFIRSVTAGRYGGLPPRLEDGYWNLLWTRLEPDALHVPLSCAQGPLPALTFVQAGDRKLVATGGVDGSVRMWSVESGTPQGHRIEAHGGSVRALLQVGGLLVSAGDDGLIKLWELPFGRAAGELAGHVDAVTALALLPRVRGALLVSGGNDGTVRFWDLEQGRQAGPPLTGHHTEIADIAVVRSRDGTVSMCTRGRDGRLLSWELHTGDYRDNDDVTEILAVAVVGDMPAFVTASTSLRERCLVVDWPDSHRRTRHSWTGSPDLMTAAAAAGRSGVIAVAAGHNGRVSLVRAATGTPLGRPLTGHTGPILRLAWSDLPGHGGVLASSGQDGTLRLWKDPSVRHSVHQQEVARHPQRTGVRLTAPLPRDDGTFAALVSEGTGEGRLVDVTTGETLPGMEAAVAYGQILGVVSLRDRVCLAVQDVGAGVIDMVDPKTGRRVSKLPGAYYRRCGAVTSVTLDDGRMLVVVGDGGGDVLLWEEPRGMYAPVKRLTGHVSPITVVVTGRAASGQRLLITAADDDTIRFWDPARPGVAAAPEGTAEHVTGLAVVSDPSGGADKLISVAGYGMHVRDLGDLSRPPRLVRFGNIHTYTGIAVVRASDGTDRVALCTENRHLLVWDPYTEQPPRSVLLDAELHGLIGAGNRLVVHTDAGPIALCLGPGA